MASIREASFGDEFSSTDVLKTLQDRLKAEGKLSIPVNSSLIPIVKTDKTITLSDDEKREIKDVAVQMCGPNDQTCLEIKTQELASSKLEEKKRASESAANIVKGRRLRIKYTTSDGKEHSAIVPEGQLFELDGTGRVPKTPEVSLTDAFSPWRAFASSLWAIIGIPVFTFLYATSILVTWMTFIKSSTRLIAIIMTAIAVFIPLSGFGLSFFGPAIAEYFRVDKLLRVMATTPEEVATMKAKGEL